MQDENGRQYDVSHHCLAPDEKLCINVDHFDMETMAANNRRKKHQHGQTVCNCVSLGLKPCIVNGKVGEKIEDDKGNHIGWKATEEIELNPRKRRRVR